MNTHILKLAKEAGVSAQSETTIHPNQVKFAELVIKDFVSRLKADTNEWLYALNIHDQDAINTLYYEQLARRLDEDWYWTP